MGDRQAFHPAPAGPTGSAGESPTAGRILSVANCRLPEFPEFRPAIGLRSGHRQTAFGAFFPSAPRLRRTVQHHVRLPDHDTIVLHDDRPHGWRRGDHVILLLHGLGGCHRSGYMMRIAAKLNHRGARTFRMDHRGCGAGASLAQSPYHAGRVDDLAQAVAFIERHCPGSLISVAGFSLSGNLLLRYLGEAPDSLPLGLFRAVAVCPPVDLQRCMLYLNRSRAGRRYDWYFTRLLFSQIADSRMWRDDLPIAAVRQPPRRLLEFDDLYTAPASGFESALHYYELASSRSVLSRIRVHTVILAAADDPVVETDCLLTTDLPPNVSLCLTQHGGHLGFISRAGPDPDRRWMDWRVVDWLLQ